MVERQEPRSIATLLSQPKDSVSSFKGADEIFVRLKSLERGSESRHSPPTVPQPSTPVPLFLAGSGGVPACVPVVAEDG